jgi:beta-galactosidase
VSRDRKTKKDTFYFYKANWNPEPMVRIASHAATPRTKARTEVKVYSNCAEVELIVNGKSLGKAMPDAIKSFVF